VALHLVDLDEPTRTLMRAEALEDQRQGRLYVSGRLSERGSDAWPNLLLAAIATGDDDALAKELRQPGMMNAMEMRKTGPAKVPVNAPEMLAEGEFNRFYIRAVCRRAVEDGIDEVEVYRAKAVSNPRRESQAKLGTRVDAAALLDDLRTHPGVDTALGLPAGPNSGLSVRLPTS
jgi:hypothetical protein